MRYVTIVQICRQHRPAAAEALPQRGLGYFAHPRRLRDAQAFDADQQQHFAIDERQRRQSCFKTPVRFVGGRQLERRGASDGCDNSAASDCSSMRARHWLT